MRRMALGAAAVGAGVWVVEHRTRDATGTGWRRAFWSAFAGLPSGRVGRVGAAVIATRHGFFEAMARELALEPDDDLLDLGCGAGGLLTEQAAHVRFVAGIDLSEIQLRKAREALAARIAAGTAEIVEGDATALPWEDGRFSVVASLDCVKFLPEPEHAFREMYRVLRPGGRAVVGLGTRVTGKASGTVDAWGQWQWDDDDARRMMQAAGFVDVTATFLAAGPKEGLVRGVKALAGYVRGDDLTA